MEALGVFIRTLTYLNHQLALLTLKSLSPGGCARSLANETRPMPAIGEEITDLETKRPTDIKRFPSLNISTSIFMKRWGRGTS